MTQASSGATITFLGAGSVVFTRELLADILGFAELADVRLVLHDIDAERLETAEAIARDTADQLGAKPEIVASLDRRRALDGARYVVNSIQVGGHAATVRDFEVPATFGLRQTIGDTIGVGGIFRALRTFPVLAGIAADMRELCPDAWLLNYTNPMAMNVAYLSAVAPDLKVLGLCHSVYWTVRGLCEVIDVPYEDVSYWSAGVNHQAWLLRWERGGREPVPAARRSGSPPTPTCAGASASTCTAGSATTRPRPASTPASTCPGTCTTTPRSSGCGSRSATTCGSARRTSPSTPPCATCSARASGCRSSGTPPSTPRRSSTRWRPARRGRSPPTSATTA